jgi:hypothetical protein
VLELVSLIDVERVDLRQPGRLGVVLRKAQNRIQDPAKLKRLIVDLIDKENSAESSEPLAARQV